MALKVNIVKCFYRHNYFLFFVVGEEEQTWLRKNVTLIAFVINLVCFAGFILRV